MSRYPLYSTSFTVYRLSPLYHGGTILDRDSLNGFAKQFKEMLSGEVLRGVRIGLGPNEEVLSRVGALREVRWTPIQSEAEWESQDGNEQEIPGKFPKILVEVRYEKAKYMAILLRNVSLDGNRDPNEQSNFSQFPLLLMRMPGTLRSTFLDFLASTFDARSSILKLSPSFLAASFETYLDNLTGFGAESVTPSESEKTLQRVLRDVLFTVAVSLPNSDYTLRSMEINIDKGDVWRFLMRGRRLANMDDSDQNQYQPFITALKDYVRHQLALDLDHECVSIAKVACGAFVLGAEGRVKIFESSEQVNSNGLHERASRSLVSQLISFAKSHQSISRS